MSEAGTRTVRGRWGGGGMPALASLPLVCRATPRLAGRPGAGEASMLSPARHPVEPLAGWVPSPPLAAAA